MPQSCYISQRSRPRRNTPRRLLAGGIAAVLFALTLGTASPAADGPMPPQIPSVEEMARLRRSLDSALGRVRQARQTLDQVLADYEAAGERLGQITGEILAVQQRLTALDGELGAAQATINKRAGAAYRFERGKLIDAIFSARTLYKFRTALSLIKSVTLKDVKSLERVRGLKGEATKARAELEDRRNEQQALILDLARRQKQLQQSLAALDVEVKKVQSEIDRRKSGFAFPVRGSYSYTNSWGAPRMEGTSYYHTHQGTDIFALKGTSVVAVVDGVIERAGTNTLGGIKLWVTSPTDRWSYYYAHLSGFAPGITSGVRVRKGDVVGYIGNTGNAQGTPPHLHFETHLPSGVATNPYPILRRIDPLLR